MRGRSRQAAKNAGHDVAGAVHARAHGRVAGADRRRVVRACSSPTADGFRNYLRASGDEHAGRALLVDKANLLTLTAPEMTVLVGGMRALDANAGQVAARRVHRPARDADATTSSSTCSTCAPRGRSPKTTPASTSAATAPAASSAGPRRWSILVFGSNAQLRALSEVYAAADGEAQFVGDFVAAWDKVMNLDRFDLQTGNSDSALAGR
ncbi:MAG: hypothetical protein MZW92_29545 [Comamonadaceae bacterium]|nr:hypothetical protein [Comamonadaceae bacterium]